MLNPAWLVSWITAGVELSQAGPTGTGIPATERLVIWNVSFDVVATAPVERLIVPVVGPLLMKCVVAVTGMSPNSLNVKVASGIVSVALMLPVAGLRFATSLPGPSGSVAFGALRNVLPVTLYLARIVLAVADAGPAVAVTAKTAARPAMPMATVVRIRGGLISFICDFSLEGWMCAEPLNGRDQPTLILKGKSRGPIISESPGKGSPTGRFNRGLVGLLRDQLALITNARLRV